MHQPLLAFRTAIARGKLVAHIRLRLIVGVQSGILRTVPLNLQKSKPILSSKYK